MCGRFANAQQYNDYRAAIRELMPDRREPRPGPDADQYRPSHNVAPSTRCPVVRKQLSSERSSKDDGEKVIIQTMRWGLIPRFHKRPPAYSESLRTINARDDMILSAQRSLWHPLLPAQRCVIFCQGFYEWQKKPSAGSGDVDRIAHFVGMSEPGAGRKDKFGQGHRLMALAGLWEKVKFEGETEELYTFTIITTESNEQLGFLHDRMPVILKDAEDIELWLGLRKDGDDTWSQEVAALLRPLKSELDCYKVPREVGKTGNEDPSFILPIEDRKDGIKAFFTKQKEPTEERAPSPSAKRDDEFDVQASKVAAEVEEDAILDQALTKTEQEEEDRKLAQKLQEEWQQGDEPAVKAEDVGDGFPVPSKRQASPSPGEERSESKRLKVEEGSSKFSPDPFNPPTSPPWPKGGYSRQDDDSSSPRKGNRKKEVNSGPMDKMLEKQREKAEQEPESRKQQQPTTPPRKQPKRKSDIRSFFSSPTRASDKSAHLDSSTLIRGSVNLFPAAAIARIPTLHDSYLALCS